MTYFSYSHNLFFRATQSCPEPKYWPSNTTTLIEKGVRDSLIEASGTGSHIQMPLFLSWSSYSSRTSFNVCQSSIGSSSNSLYSSVITIFSVDVSLDEPTLFCRGTADSCFGNFRLPTFGPE